MMLTILYDDDLSRSLYLYCKCMEYDIKTRFTHVDAKGKELPSKTVFAHAIRYLKEQSLQEIRHRGKQLSEENLHWDITVPTSWGETAIHTLKEAVVQAGIQTFSIKPKDVNLSCELENQASKPQKNRETDIHSQRSQKKAIQNLYCLHQGMKSVMRDSTEVYPVTRHIRNGMAEDSNYWLNSVQETVEKVERSINCNISDDELQSHPKYMLEHLESVVETLETIEAARKIREVIGTDPNGWEAAEADTDCRTSLGQYSYWPQTTDEDIVGDPFYCESALKTKWFYDDEGTVDLSLKKKKMAILDGWIENPVECEQIEVCQER